MSYNGSGVFNINTSGQPVVTGTVISSTAFNALTSDLGTGLSTAITKDGQTTATARIPFAAGINSSLVTDATSTTTGSIITAGGVGIAKALYVGTTANIAGASTLAAVNASTLVTTTSIGVGNVTLSGSGSGVQFPATQSASTDANTLDDYEEGTWTPSLGGTAIYSSQIGRYTKVGRICTFTLYMNVTTIGTGSTTTISGLPFTLVMPGGSYAGGGSAVISASAISHTAASLQGIGGSTTITVSLYTANANSTLNQQAVFQSTTQITGTIVCEVS